jgi:UDPglucose 6-dehydrogenase
MKIAVVGTGYVGLVSGTCFASIGHEVICIDNDQSKIDNLKNNGIIPIYEPGLEELVKRNVEEGRLSFTTDLNAAVKQASAVFIAVGTPPRPDNGQADLKYVYQVAEEIANAIDKFTVVIDKSTVPIGTAEEVDAIIKKVNPKADFAVVSNPEFLREGSAINDFLEGDRVVVGVENEQAEKVMAEIYKPLSKNGMPVVMTKVRTAEMIKYASNTFLAVKLGFINEISDLCEKVGADIQEVAYSMGLDTRIGEKFLQAGPGFGGSCFPKDTKALKYIADSLADDSKDKNATRLTIVNATIESNLNRKEVMARKVKTILGKTLKGKKVAVLGVAFKANTDDCRESPALNVIKEIQARRGEVVAFDPVAMNEAKKVTTNIKFAKNEYEACEGADAVVILTEWPQFASLDLDKVKSNLKSPLIIDLRNMLDPNEVKQKGFEYHSIGR